MTILFLPHFILVGMLIVSAFTDFTSRRIPNWLTFGGTVIGLTLSLTPLGLVTATHSLYGILTGLVILLPVYAFGKVGAGDVKLMGTVGAFLGPIGLLWALVWSLLAGGVMALLWMVYEAGGPRELIYRAIGSLALANSKDHVVAAGSNSPLKSKMPYAGAIAIGTVFSWLVAPQPVWV